MQPQVVLIAIATPYSPSPRRAAASPLCELPGAGCQRCRSGTGIMRYSLIQLISEILPIPCVPSLPRVTSHLTAGGEAVGVTPLLVEARA